MKKVILSIIIAVAIPVLVVVIHSFYFYKPDPLTQAYLDEKDPKKKMMLIEQMLNSDEHNRWNWLDNAAELAYEIGDYKKAEQYALESLASNADHTSSWNYGNSIHDSNTVLGMLDLKQGNIDAAKQHLREAAKSKGSPQLDTFGPNLDLANELLKRGEKEAVLEYLSSIATFWEMDDGRVSRWIEEIKANQTPELYNSNCKPCAKKQSGASVHATDAP